jgi:uncharacterized protein YjdB
MRFRAFSVALLLSLTGCSLVSPCGTDELSFRVTPTSQAVSVGESFTPVAEFRGCGGKRHLDDTITWSAADTNIVQVNAVTGRVTGRALGVTEVQARGVIYGSLPAIAVNVK